MNKIFHVFSIFSFVLFAAVDTPSGSYSKKESGFYLGHFDRSPDLAGYIGKFDGNVVRGGQPNFNDGTTWINKLKDNSVALVIDLRKEGLSLTKERNDLKAAGISYVILPWNTDGSDQSPKLKVTERIFVKGIYTEHTETFDRVDATLRVLKLANEYLDSNQRIYVHCQRGEDRTGTFISLLRDLKDNWKKEFSNYGGSYYTALRKHREDVVRKMQQLNP